jgi:hypothetical protein
MERGLRRHAAWVLVSLAYLVASPYYERINNPNENVRVWATRAIVEHHALDIDQVSREWGWVNDKAKNDRHVYSGKAPGTSFLGVPVLWLHTKLRAIVGWPSPGKREATFWLRLFAVKLPLALFFYCFSRYVERVTRSTLARDLLVVGLGLGTLVYPYGNLFVGHALAAAAAFSAFMLLDGPPDAGHTDEEQGRGGRWRYRELLRSAAAGLLAGATVALEYQAALVAAALGVYAAVRYRARALAFVAGTLPPAFALGAYHVALFGRPWRFPFGNVENAEYARTAHAAGFHGLSLPHLTAFPSFLFSPAYGLFALSPLLVVGAVGAGVAIARGGGERRDGRLIAAICVLMFLFLAGMSNWRAGWCVGPRYIATVAPFLILGIVRLWPRIEERWWGPAVVAGLLIPSVVLNVVSGALYPHYPEVFDNPVFDLAFPLLGDRYAPYGLGWALHLHGAWAMAPLGAIALGAVALGASGDESNPRAWARQLAVAIGIAAFYLGVFAAYGQALRPDEARAAAFVRATWEPPRR